jgi:hypothetical protein
MSEMVRNQPQPEVVVFSSVGRHTDLMIIPTVKVQFQLPRDGEPLEIDTRQMTGFLSGLGVRVAVRREEKVYCSASSM